MDLKKFVVPKIIWGILALLSCIQGTCQTIFSSFNDLAALDSLTLTIETDAKKLAKQRDNKQWFPAQMTVLSGQNVVAVQSIDVRTRGKTRLEICGFPPLKLRLNGKDSTELKIVSDCDNYNNSAHNVLKEHLMYSIYQNLTPESYRTLLVELIIKPTGSNKPFYRSSAILIEDDASLALRLGGTEFKPPVMSPTGIDPACLDRLCMFQFMIGNTDWSIYNRHNIKLIKILSERRVVAIPYDFDYAGAVGATYAVPAEGLPIRTVRERYYTGLCRPEEATQSVIAHFKAQRTAIMDICEHYDALPTSERRQVARYLTTFFELLDSPEAVNRQIIEHCNNFKKE